MNAQLRATPRRFSLVLLTAMVVPWLFGVEPSQAQAFHDTVCGGGVSLNGGPVAACPTPMAGGSIVSAPLPATATMTFSSTWLSSCQLTGLPSVKLKTGKLKTKPGHLQTRVPAADVFTLQQGWVSCGVKPPKLKNGQKPAPWTGGLCYNGSVQANGTGLVAGLAQCNLDPLFEFAVFQGEFTVVDPAGVTHVLSAGQEVSCDPVPSCVAAITKASFTPQQQAALEEELKVVS